MNLKDLISPRCIRVPIQSKNKKDVIAELVDMLVSVKKLPRRDNIYDALIEREEVGSTGIGHGVALPHAKCAEVKEIYVACGIAPEGIDFDALDQEPVYIVFLLLAPRSAAGQLKVMQILTRILSQSSAREALLKATDADDLYSVLIELTEKQAATGAS
ncbi:MAG: PTS sugar transporter subunit IIA [Candidatus Omnitrophica bacterium]|nr:PTS sugar transporter subunit IIA [Candidatus Omnitrophota bacterium]